MLGGILERTEKMGDVTQVKTIDGILHITKIRQLRTLGIQLGVDLTGCKRISDIQERLMNYFRVNDPESQNVR